MYIGQNCITHVDAPELLHRIESDNFLEQVVPIIALQMVVSRLNVTHAIRKRGAPSH